MNRTARLIAGVAVTASAALASLGAATASAASCLPGSAPLPAVLTNAATGVNATGATLHATVDPNGCATTYSFDYGTTISYGSVTPARSAGAGTNLVSATAAIAGLSPNTLYHFKIVATSTAGTTSGGDMTLQTEISCAPGAAPPPSVLSSAATRVTTTRAVLRGTVDPSACATVYRFEYGTTTAYGNATPERQASPGAKTVSADASIGGLVPDTVYHFRIVATSAAGSAAGSDMTLTTGSACAAGAPPPSVLTSPATGVGRVGATLRGSVDPNGCATKYRFEYGRTTRYGSFTTARSVGAGKNQLSATAAIRALSPGTVYHFRIVAISAAGRTTGGDVALTTDALSPSRVRIVSRRAGIVRHFVAKITLRCTRGVGRCIGTLKIFRNRGLIGRAHFSIRPTRSAVIRVALNRRGRRLMSAHERRRVKLVATGGHNRAVRFITVTRRYRVR